MECSSYLPAHVRVIFSLRMQFMIMNPRWIAVMMLIASPLLLHEDYLLFRRAPPRTVLFVKNFATRSKTIANVAVLIELALQAVLKLTAYVRIVSIY